MKFQVSVPASAMSERRYIVPLILSEFLGIDIELIPDSTIKDVCIHLENKTLLFPDSFFSTYNRHRLEPLSMPKRPLKSKAFYFESLPENLKGKNIPIIYGELSSPSVTLESSSSIYIEIDIFGSAFFMLTRYEEVISDQKDSHNRFPACASLAYKERFLERPIINEYIEILWAAIKQLWPNTQRKPRVFQQFISCDVDFPYHPSTTSIAELCKRLAGDLLSKHSLGDAISHWNNYWACKKGDYSLDPYFTFNWIMKECENVGLRCAFNFICDTRNKARDGYYHLEEPIIHQLIQDISSKGHEIGLHTTYDSYLSAEKIAQEFDTIKSLCKSLGIQQSNWGGRQHYLRWKTPLTFAHWSDAGLTYDSTLGYADHAGFRCGICYEYPAYDLVNRKPLNLRERPLVLMETSVLSSMYMKQNYDQKTLDYMVNLKNTCKQYHGDFTLLWHNSKLNTDSDKAFYKTLLAA